MNEYINVNLCSGIDIGRLAWDNSGLPKAEWHCFEFDKYANAVGRYHYPDITRHGDARNYTKLIGKDIFLLMGGFPCQPYSMAGKQKGDLDSRDLSNLVFQSVIDLKPKYFLFENVKMKKEHRDRISQQLGVEAIEINSADFSAQSRTRLYWTNIPIKEWEDRGIVLRDILVDNATPDLVSDQGKTLYRGDIDKSHCLMARDYKGFGNQAMTGVRTVLVGDAEELSHYNFNSNMRVYSQDGKAPTLTTSQGGHREPKVATHDPKGGRIVNRRKIDGVRKDDQLELPLLPYLEVRGDDKTNCLTTIQKDNVVADGLTWRKLLPIECERLQTVPDNFTEWGVFVDDKNYDPTLHEVYQRKKISNSQRYKQLGNGWTCAVIEHILKGVEI
jgi:site-specific DNA-cytosine methylase